MSPTSGPSDPATPNPSHDGLDTPQSQQQELRARTNTAEIDNTISHPGSVKINVKGAFIVDGEVSSPSESPVGAANHQTKDIRLPNHTAVVSHIAVDV
jgi:type II pantothenate kinase